MTPSSWIEAVLSPNVFWANGSPLEPFKPFEVTRPIRFGPAGSDADLIWAEPHELEVSPAPGGVIGKSTPGSAIGSLVRQGVTWENAPLLLRVIGSPHDSAVWPSDLTRPPAPWTDETLSVIGDQLLERGRSVGQRFITREDDRDGFWLPLFAGTRLLDGVAGWHRGVVRALRLSASPSREFARALAMQAVCAPLEDLELSFPPFSEYSSVVSGLIAGGGLACLERLRFTIDRNTPLRVGPMMPDVAQRLRKLPGFDAAFPALQTFELEQAARPPRPYGVVG